MKNKKNGQTQWFLEVVDREVLMFWGLKRVRWKNSCLSPFCQNWGLAPIWLSHACLRGDENVWRHLALSVGIWLYRFCFLVSGGVFHLIWVIFWDARAAWGCLRLTPWGIQSDWSQLTNLTQPWKTRCSFTWLFWGIKISKPPYLPFPKITEFCNFSYFSYLSERNYNLQSHTSTKLYLTQNFSNCRILPLTPQYT